MANGGDGEQMTTVADEELKKKIALYYHSLVSILSALTFRIVPRLPRAVVCPPPTKKLHQAHQEAVHRAECADIEVPDIRF